MFLRPSRLTHTWVCASTAASADASVRVQRTRGHMEGRHVRVHAHVRETVEQIALPLCAVVCMCT